MPSPRLPTPPEAAEILTRKRSRPPRQPPPPAGRALAPYLKTLEDRFGKGPKMLFARWPEILGDERLARLTEPVKVVKLRGQAASVLELKVEGPAATLVQHRAEEILERVNLVLGPGSVGRIRIVQGKVQPATGRAAARIGVARRIRLPPLDAAREAALEASVAGAKDEGLRHALVRLGRAVLSRDPER
jgi:hypothetical protein